jgi:hypothetical protein
LSTCRRCLSRKVLTTQVIGTDLDSSYDEINGSGYRSYASTAGE